MGTNNNKTELTWPGKSADFERVTLPFQCIETVQNGKRITKSKSDSLELFESYEPHFSQNGHWNNLLIWGENKYVLSSLLKDFEGKIDLIYIDPPFASGANFSFKVKIGDQLVTKEQSIIEEKTYRDTWGRGIESYLDMIYQRLILMKSFLKDTGSIYIHLDWHLGHYVKLVLDEIFGKENFVNEIVWKKYSGVKNQASKKFTTQTDSIFIYSKTGSHTFNQLYREMSEEYIKQEYKYIDEKGRKYALLRGRGYQQTGENKRKYLDEAKGAPITTLWDDNYLQLNTSCAERIGYDTQKPEALLERIIKASSNVGGLIADFFCGSGTACAVAEKLGRRWLGCDLSRYAIHVTRKRLLETKNCKPFKVLNLGKYERKYWQGLEFGLKTEHQPDAYFQYIEFILQLYKAKPISGYGHLHGKKGQILVHVGAVDAPVTISEISETISECKESPFTELDILGWEWEMGIYEPIVQEAKNHGIKLRLLNIPREVMDRRATDAGDVQFFELAFLKVNVNKQGRTVQVELEDFVISNPELIPDEVRQKITKWSDYVDYWAIDWNFQHDTFMNHWQNYRTRNNRKLNLVSDPHTYPEAGCYRILVKVIDIFGNDTSELVTVEVSDDE